MSYLDSAVMEAKVLIAKRQDSRDKSNPVLAPAAREHSADWVAKRIDEALDYIFASGHLS